MELQNTIFSQEHQILSRKRILIPAEIFWIFETENIHSKEVRLLRIALMYYWDQIAEYTDVSELKISNSESMDYYYIAKKTLDKKESAFINDIYHLWRMLRITILNTEFNGYEVDPKNACEIYDLLISQLKCFVNNQEIIQLKWYSHNLLYNKAIDCIKIINDIRCINNIFNLWPYKGAIEYYLKINSMDVNLVDLENNVTTEYRIFKQKYEQYNDSDFIDFHIININQNYDILNQLITPSNLEFIKDILYELRDQKYLIK